MRFINPTSCLDSAMEREAVKAGLVIHPTFPENVPVGGIPIKEKNWGEPAPVKNDKPAIYELVLQDVQERAKFGYAKYKTFLQPGNGRNALKDAYEEALDLCMYLRQKIYEEQGK